MRTSVVHVVSLVALSVLAPPGLTQIIGFENNAPAGGLVNVGPPLGYPESGIRFVPSNNQSAIFDSAASTVMLGNTSDYFGFGETNTITLTNLFDQPFALTSLLAGPISAAGGGPITINMVGNVFGGGTLNASFPGLTTATLETLNWSNLASVTITTTNDAGIDNINITPVPEPTSIVLVGVGLIARTICARNRKPVT